MPYNPKLLQNQAHAYAETLHYLCGQVFRTRKPADRIVAAHFRANRKFGSRDRRLLSETYFAIFRWWGWLRHIQGVDEAMWELDARRAVRHEPWLRVLLAAHLLDNVELHPVSLVWKEELGETGYLAAVGKLPIAERAEKLGHFLGNPNLTWRDLIPDWLFTNLPLPAERQQPFVEMLQTRPPMWLRAQTRDLTGLVTELRRGKLTVYKSPHLPNALRVDEPQVNLYEITAFREGLFEVQDFASQAIGHVCNAQPGERWWDACAGAGGKTLQLASQMQNKGTILATDIRAYKLEDLRKRARRADLSNIRTRPWDGKSKPAKGDFDGVLVDAPCSNTGTWRRNPDARWTTTPDEIAKVAELQADILRLAAPHVAIGGRLIYATCSLCPEENEAIVHAFLKANPDYRLEPIEHPVTADVTDGMLRIWPQEADCDGTFVAAMRRLKQPQG